MPLFESGVASYIHAVAKIDVYFPVDGHGNSHICCEQCFFYRDSSRSCGLNHESCTFPSKYVGGACPLIPVDTEQAGKIESVFCEIAEQNAQVPSLDTNE